MALLLPIAMAINCVINSKTTHTCRGGCVGHRISVSISGEKRTTYKWAEDYANYRDVENRE